MAEKIVKVVGQDVMVLTLGKTGWETVVIERGTLVLFGRYEPFEIVK